MAQVSALDNELELPEAPLSWGILATHPAHFEHATHVRNLGLFRSPYLMTSRGLRVTLPVLQHQ